MKTLTYFFAALLVLSSCKKSMPCPDPGSVYSPDPYSDGTYDPDPDPDPDDPYTDPSDPGDPGDPSDPGDPGDPGDSGDGTDGSALKHHGHTVHLGKATNFNNGSPNGGAAGK